MDAFNQERKFLLSMIVSAAVAALCVGGFVVSVLVIKSYQKNFLDTRRVLARLDQERSQASGLEKLLSDIKGDRRELESAFIESGRVVQLIEELEGIARGYNSSIRIQSFEVNDVSQPPRFVFDISGDMADVMAFVEYFEYLPYQVEIESLFIDPDFRGARGVPMSGVVGFNITAIIHNFIR